MYVFLLFKLKIRHLLLTKFFISMTLLLKRSPNISFTSQQLFVRLVPGHHTKFQLGLVALAHRVYKLNILRRSCPDGMVESMRHRRRRSHVHLMNPAFEGSNPGKHTNLDLSNRDWVGLDCKSSDLKVLDTTQIELLLDLRSNPRIAKIKSSPKGFDFTIILFLFIQDCSLFMQHSKS